MRKKRWIFRVLTIFTSLMIVGCSSSGNMKKETIVLEDSTEIKISEDGKVQSSTKVGEQTEIPIYLIKNDKNEIRYISTEKNATLEEKLSIISKGISQECFNGLPIELELQDKLAIVNLIEDESLRVSWKDDYLNEDTIEDTEKTLVKSLLQEDYQGEWIKEISLYYNGEEIK